VDNSDEELPDLMLTAVDVPDSTNRSQVCSKICYKY